MGALFLWACALPKEAGDRGDRGLCLCSPEPGRGRAPQEALRNTWPGDQKSGHPVTLAFTIAAHSPELAGKAGGLLGLGLAVTIQGPAGTREPSVHCVPCPGGTLEMRVPVSLSKRSWPKTEPHLHAGLCPALYAPRARGGLIAPAQLRRALCCPTATALATAHTTERAPEAAAPRRAPARALPLPRSAADNERAIRRGAARAHHGSERLEKAQHKGSTAAPELIREARG